MQLNNFFLWIHIILILKIDVSSNLIMTESELQKKFINDVLFKTGLTLPKVIIIPTVLELMFGGRG